MKKIDRHIALPFDLLNKLKTLSKENEITYTSLVEELIRKGIDEIDILKKIKEIESELIYIKNKMNLAFELLMQIYADMDFDNIKDIKNSNALKNSLEREKT